MPPLLHANLFFFPLTILFTVVKINRKYKADIIIWKILNFLRRVVLFTIIMLLLFPIVSDNWEK